MKTPLLRSAALIAVLVAFAATPVLAQDLHSSRRPSPVGIASTHLGDTYVKVTYGRPYMRGRQIFGENSEGEAVLVPFGNIWRTGANEATEITTTGPLLVAGERLEAGTYALFTEPGPQTWVIHFSPQLGLDGTGLFDAASGQFTPNVYDPSLDVLVVRVPSQTIEEDVDQFTISFDDASEAGAGTAMVLSWERTEVRIPVAPAN